MTVQLVTVQLVTAKLVTGVARVGHGPVGASGSYTGRCVPRKAIVLAQADLAADSS